MTTYDATSIRILRDREVTEHFAWAEVGALAEQYRRPESWIRRGLEACDRAGVEHGHIIRRYLRGDKTEPPHDGVQAAFRDILSEARR